MRIELQTAGKVSRDSYLLTTLVPRSELTGTDRAWEARYQVGDVIEYSRGSAVEGIKRGSQATVVAVNARENILTVRQADGQSVTYDPTRLRGVSVYREAAIEIAPGDRIQFTRADRDLGLRRGDLATVEKVYGNESLSLRLDTRKTVSVDATQAGHIEYGYAVDGAKTVRADRVLANIDRPSQLEHASPLHKSLSLARGDVALYTRAQPLLYEPKNGEQMLAYAEAIAKTQPPAPLAVSAKPLSIAPAQKQQTAQPIQAEAAGIARPKWNNNGYSRKRRSRGNRLSSGSLSNITKPYRQSAIASLRSGCCRMARNGLSSSTNRMA